MSMLLQQAFQQATPRWQRNWIVLPPSIIAGSTGLSGKGTSWSVVVLIDAHPEKRHRAPVHWAPGHYSTRGYCVTTAAGAAFGASVTFGGAVLKSFDLSTRSTCLRLKHVHFLLVLS